MTGRDDLDELHALAASIAEETQGWRAHRRQRAIAAAQARNEDILRAPVQRRRRHRWIAASIAGVVILVGAGVAVVFWPAAHSAPPAPPVRSIRLASDIRAGDQAARQIASQGRVPNLFSCQSIYVSDQLGAPTGHPGSAWRTGYLNACTRAAAANGSTG